VRRPLALLSAGAHRRDAQLQVADLQRRIRQDFALRERQTIEQRDWHERASFGEHRAGAHFDAKLFYRCLVFGQPDLAMSAAANARELGVDAQLGHPTLRVVQQEFQRKRFHVSPPRTSV
jgi:hypothetical protein